MDNQSNSTTAPFVSIGEAANRVVDQVAAKRSTTRRSDEIADAYRDLEDPICRAHNMAVILDGVLDTVTYQCKRGTKPIHLSNEEIEALAFAWKEVRGLTGTVREKFYAVEAEGSNNG